MNVPPRWFFGERRCKTAGVPIHRLLGPQVHETTPLSWWNIDMAADDMASECAEAYRQGYRSYKTKGRPWFDIWKQMDASSKVVPPRLRYITLGTSPS